MNVRTPFWMNTHARCALIIIFSIIFFSFEGITRLQKFEFTEIRNLQHGDIIMVSLRHAIGWCLFAFLIIWLGVEAICQSLYYKFFLSQELDLKKHLRHDRFTQSILGYHGGLTWPLKKIQCGLRHTPKVFKGSIDFLLWVMFSYF